MKHVRQDLLRSSWILAAAAAILAAHAGRSQAGEHGHGLGARLDPGRVSHGPYDAPIPGWRPGHDSPWHGHDDCGPHFGWLNLNSHTPYVRTGMYRYPLTGLGGYIPPGPFDDCLYRTGQGPLSR